MPKISGWGKPTESHDGGIPAIHYRSEYGSLLEIVTPWTHTSSTFIAYSPFGGKTHIIYKNLSKSVAIKNARIFMKTHK